MSMLTEVWILERYGVRLDTEQLAGLLGLTKPYVHSMIAEGTCPVPTYLDGGRRFADYRDVAIHFDECRKKVVAPNTSRKRDRRDD